MIIDNFDGKTLILQSFRLLNTYYPNCIGLPAVINRTYIDQASYRLTYFLYVHDSHSIIGICLSVLHEIFESGLNLRTSSSMLYISKPLPLLENFVFIVHAMNFSCSSNIMIVSLSFPPKLPEMNIYKSEAIHGRCWTRFRTSSTSGRSGRCCHRFLDEFMRVQLSQVPAYVCFRLKGQKWWGTYLPPAPSIARMAQRRYRRSLIWTGFETWCSIDMTS